MARALERLLDKAWADLSDGNHLAARSGARRAARDPALRAEALHLLGRIALDRGEAAEALRALEASRKEGADWPDLFYDIGLAHEDMGDTRSMIAAFLIVLDKDPQHDDIVTRHLDEDELVATAVALLEELPPEMTSKMGNVPVMVEERPARHLVEEGFDPRALGVFEGAPWSEQGLTGPALNRIVLYRANIAAVTRGPADAREQVRITLLHETAHFFGLDEDGVADLGLA